jgi:hypothetical protein
MQYRIIPILIHLYITPIHVDRKGSSHSNALCHERETKFEANFERFVPGNLPVYGFGVEGCPEWTPDCFPSGQEVAIVCYLPRDLCGDGSAWT